MDNGIDFSFVARKNDSINPFGKHFRTRPPGTPNSQNTGRHVVTRFTIIACNAIMRVESQMSLPAELWKRGCA